MHSERTSFAIATRRIKEYRVTQIWWFESSHGIQTLTDDSLDGSCFLWSSAAPCSTSRYTRHTDTLYRQAVRSRFPTAASLSSTVHEIISYESICVRCWLSWQHTHGYFNVFHTRSTFYLRNVAQRSRYHLWKLNVLYGAYNDNEELCR